MDDKAGQNAASLLTPQQWQRWVALALCRVVHDLRQFQVWEDRATEAQFRAQRWLDKALELLHELTHADGLEAWTGDETGMRRVRAALRQMQCHRRSRAHEGTGKARGGFARLSDAPAPDGGGHTLVAFDGDVGLFSPLLTALIRILGSPAGGRGPPDGFVPFKPPATIADGLNQWAEAAGRRKRYEPNEVRKAVGRLRQALRQNGLPPYVETFGNAYRLRRRARHEATGNSRHRQENA